jgi:hypothetical protein
MPTQHPQFTTPSIRNHHASQKPRYDSNCPPSDAMANTNTTPVSSPKTPSASPPVGRTRWGLRNSPNLRSTHEARFRVFKQTRSLSRHKTAQTYITSLRGYQCKLPPTRPTRPALRHRRHSIDVTTVDDYSFSYEEFTEENDHAVPSMPVSFEPVPTVGFLNREMDEPTLREPTIQLPDPRRYEELNLLCNFPPLNDEKYLEVGDSSITNAEFHLIPELAGTNSWFTDNILDVALEMVRLEYETDSHEIAITVSTAVQLLYMAGVGLGTEGMDHYKESSKDKKWIFLPINDGLDGTTPTHWSLLVVNRHDYTAHYVDSLYPDSGYHVENGQHVAKGLGILLDEEYQFVVEEYAPNQKMHNTHKIWRDGVKLGEDAGPCGPFVVTMTKIYIQEITLAEGYCHADLYLAFDFPSRFRHLFNSYLVRQDIQNKMAELKKKLMARELTAAHDAVVLAGQEDVEMADAQWEPLFNGTGRIMPPSLLTEVSESSSSSSTIALTPSPPASETEPWWLNDDWPPL